MPMFEYTCRSCGFEFEELVTSDKEKITCPKCLSSEVSRKLSVFSASGSSSGSSCSAPAGSGFR